MVLAGLGSESKVMVLAGLGSEWRRTVTIGRVCLGLEVGKRWVYFGVGSLVFIVNEEDSVRWSGSGV